jgi:hypothetical protein
MVTSVPFDTPDTGHRPGVPNLAIFSFPPVGNEADRLAGYNQIISGVGKDSSQKLTDLGMREKSEQF